MEDYILNNGVNIVSNKALLRDPILFTVKIFALKSEIDVIVKKSLCNDIQFVNIRDLSFKNFMNNYSMIPQLIASYCDY